MLEVRFYTYKQITKKVFLIPGEEKLKIFGHSHCQCEGVVMTESVDVGKNFFHKRAGILQTKISVKPSKMVSCSADYFIIAHHLYAFLRYLEI